MFFEEEKMITRENKRMVKLEYFSKTNLFELTLKKSSRSLLSGWSVLLVHIQFTLSERPKDFVN